MTKFLIFLQYIFVKKQLPCQLWCYITTKGCVTFICLSLGPTTEEFGAPTSKEVAPKQGDNTNVVKVGLATWDKVSTPSSWVNRTPLPFHLHSALIPVGPWLLNNYSHSETEVSWRAHIVGYCLGIVFYCTHTFSIPHVT